LRTLDGSARRRRFRADLCHEERQQRLALAAQDVEVDLDPGARW
jgi:hypothetical protein